MTRTFFPAVALLGMLTCAPAQSALRWDNKTLDVRPAPADKTARAEFGFTNVGKQPVVIDSVKSSCGCTTASLEKKVYQPGEKGHITSVFTIGGHTGVQVKGISVKVKGDAEPTVLSMVTHISEDIKMDPPFVFWRTGEAPRPKTIRLKVPASLAMRLERVSSSDPHFLASLETLREGADYKITVTPQETDRQMTAVLKIQAVSRSNEPKVLQAYAQVKAPR